MRKSVRRAAGLARSLVLYRRPGWRRRLLRLYGPFIPPGGLAFDLGAHLGDRAAAFAALGARVVALEPQPHVAPWLQRLAGRDPLVTVREEAVGDRPGTGKLAVSLGTPTVSTLSSRWTGDLAAPRRGFARVRWEESVRVPVTTLDLLLEEHGIPDFVKMDLEGSEAAALAGLSRAVPALSMEFVREAPEVAEEAIRRLTSLGSYEFNAVRGEDAGFALERWTDASGIQAWLAAGADGVPSGDLFARLCRGRRPDGAASPRPPD